MQSNLFIRSFTADGNFKVDHLQQCNKADDVWLTDGESFMKNHVWYRQHLDSAIDHKQVCLLRYQVIPILEPIGADVGTNWLWKYTGPNIGLN